MKRFRLSAVARARRATEDVAKTAAARAKANAEASARLVRTYERDIDQRSERTETTTMAFCASITALQATASALSDALDVEQMANDQVDERLAELRAASARRKAIDRLAERHEREQLRLEERAEQDAMDDLSSAKHHRDRGRP